MTSLLHRFFRTYVRCIWSKHPPSDNRKKRERPLYAVDAGVANGAFRWRSCRGKPGDPSAVALSGALTFAALYSHSMVPGGLLVMSSTTRLTSDTSLVMRVEMRSST